jgi:16S rRNA (adenine1518-N6/adenine1519-N6)-dimethyltransferase
MQKKKSLGQHFLRSKNYLNAITDAADIKRGEVVVEIGPGEGALTEVLLARGAHVVAIEKDSRLISFLLEKFAHKNFELIEGDALEYAPPKKYKLVGNIPYYISGALIKKFLTAENQPTTLVYLVQKEVAERIARSKKESILSLSVKAYGTPTYIKTVPAGAFSPPPTVDSAILLVQNISRNNFANVEHEKKFFELVKKGFAQKRKFLLNNIGKIYAPTFEKLKISPQARAEDISLKTWLALATDRSR